MENINQREIAHIWQNIWIKEGGISASKVLESRLSIESYGVIKKYILPDTQSILEVGTGSGRFSLRFAQDLPGAKIIATDIVVGALANVEKLKRELDIENIEVKKEDVMSLSFADNVFDLVFSDAVIQHLNPGEQQKAVNEMTRVLRPGGRIIISVVNFWNFHTVYKWIKNVFGGGYPYGYEKSYTKKKLRNMLRNSGLKIIAEDGFYVGYGIFRLKKYNRIFHFLGRAVNRLSKILDQFTNRFFSKNFGFEIVVVGEKLL